MPRRIRFKGQQVVALVGLAGVVAAGVALGKSQTIALVALIYVFLLAALRLLGKREFGQLSPLELVCLLIIPELIQQAVIRNDDSISNALAAVSTLLVLVYATSLITQRSRTASEALEGRPLLLAANGKMLADHMNQERITPDELLTEVRRNGLERVEDVKWAVLEPDGKISIIPMKPGGPEP